MKFNPVWKTNNQSQLSLLPPSYDDFVPDNHPVRIVNIIIDKIDISSIEKTYKGGALQVTILMIFSRYWFIPICAIFILPVRLSKLWEKIFTLCGSAVAYSQIITPLVIFVQISLKVSSRLFLQVVLLLANQGYLNIKDIYVDGTKIEANANRYTFVWGKSIKNSCERIKKELKEL